MSFPLGDAILQFVPGPPKSTEFIQNGDYLEGKSVGNPLQVVRRNGRRIEPGDRVGLDAGREIGRLAGYLNEFLVNNDEQFNRIVQKTELAHRTAFQKVASDFDDVLSDEKTRANMKQAITEMPALMKDTRDAVAGIHSTVALADSNLRNLEGLTKPLGDHGEEMISNVDASMARLNEVLDQFDEFGKISQ